MTRKWPEVRKMPVSSLKHPEKYCGKIQYIEFRSSYEISAAKYLDRNDSILQWSSEENIVYYKSPIDKRRHRYFVDFYIKYKVASGKTKEALIEIKPYKDTLDKPQITEGMSSKTKETVIHAHVINQAKWSAARAYCNKRNMSFFVLTEKDLLLK